MPPAVLVDDEVLHRTTQLVEFLAKVTDAANRNPLRDICSSSTTAPDPLIWIDDLPDGVPVRLDTEGELLRMRPVPRIAPPALPAELTDRLERPRFDDPDRVPALRVPVGEVGDSVVDTHAAQRVLDRWLVAWRRWAATERVHAEHRRLYALLELAAARMEAHDDEFECVLATGLICWQAPDGREVRRHLTVETVRPVIDKRTAEVTIMRPGADCRLEDGELFDGLPAYRPVRGRTVKDELEAGAPASGSPELVERLTEWLGLVVDAPATRVEARIVSPAPLPTTLELSASPAIMVRQRSRVRVALSYRHIAEELRDANTPIPIGLAQLVVDTEREQRDGWLERQGATRGVELGDDPLFPAATNDEQRRVIEMLRTETGVVVQGPPGTGKTHTIANIISALLARGQRVLVTSQKDQALRVLRDKIPKEIRHLCVLLAGGRTGAAERKDSLDAFANALAASDRSDLEGQVRRFSQERDGLVRRLTTLNEEIGQLREVENIVHLPVAPEFSTELYRGPLMQIVNDVKAGSDRYDWMPQVPAEAPPTPPLDHQQLRELWSLLREHGDRHAARAEQAVPAVTNVPTPAVFQAALVAEGQVADAVRRWETPLSAQLAVLDTESLRRVDTLAERIERLLNDCGLSGLGRPPGTDWVMGAVADRLAGRNHGLWGHVLEVRDEAARLQTQLRLQGVQYVVDMPAVAPSQIGMARGQLEAGAALHEHLRTGGKLRKYGRKPVQRDAQVLLDAARVNGRSPSTAEDLDAVLARLEAEVAVVQLAQKWLDAGVQLQRSGNTHALLSELADNAKYLELVDSLGTVHEELRSIVGHAGPAIDLSTVEAVRRVKGAVPAARARHDLRVAGERLLGLQQVVGDVSDHPRGCPELAPLVRAAMERDLPGYGAAVHALARAREEQTIHARITELTAALEAAHPELAEELVVMADDDGWEVRLADAAGAWAWSRARQFVEQHRTAERERALSIEHERLDEHLQRVTAKLVAATSMKALTERMTDAHSRALNTYREHAGKIGAGAGKKTQEFRRAARSAMRKAQHAVPAWVVPLPELLEHLDPERDSFDVVVVDEASQVGIEHLYLLWLAPRVIVVGDDKQCTPGAGRFGDLEALFSKNAELMPDIDHEIRMNFNHRSHLYGVLSARSGRDSVVRLREHFRCVPEIIQWSSQEFYPDNAGGPGLVPLRTRRAGSLEPLVVVPVEGAEMEGRESNRRNVQEAKVIVETLVACVNDPRYQDKTFGIVVLQSPGQVKYLEHAINDSGLSAEARQRHGIRVGLAADFQGDERDVIFLSMMVSSTPQAQRAEVHEQRFNVAASRAKDQMWLFTSVGLGDLKEDDLRASLLRHMLAKPSVYGRSPDMEEVSADEPCEPFESIFEQRVFRELKKRGYHVVPQFPVGARRIDLVVSGEGGRVAVECDGHRWHADHLAQVNDARRDRELARQRWTTVRVRESEFASTRSGSSSGCWTPSSSAASIPSTGPLPEMELRHESAGRHRARRCCRRADSDPDLRGRPTASIPAGLGDREVLPCRRLGRAGRS